MTTENNLPQQVQKYLDVSTCLLFPHLARQVRAELIGNMHQDMLDSFCFGASEEAAWQQALEQAGPAWKVALGLARVHTLGLVWRALLLGGVLGGAAFAVQSGSLDIQHVQVSHP